MKEVTFKKKWDKYHKGETATFVDHIADLLVSRGFAVTVDLKAPPVNKKVEPKTKREYKKTVKPEEKAKTEVKDKE